MSKTYDLAVLGAGPGGYVAAIRAAQLGMNVACIDDNELPGGTCLRIGCIPSKALLESSEKFAEMRSAKEMKAHGIKVETVELDLPQLMKRKDRVVKGLTGGVKMLLAKNKVDHFVGRGRLTAPGKIEVEGADGGTVVEAERILLATGTVPATLPGIELGGKIGTSTEGLAYDQVPEHLVVIGAGYIGLEMGSVWARLGAKVTVLEYLDRILPGADAEIAAAAQKIFAKQGLDFQLGARVTGARDEDDGCVVEAEGHDPIHCDAVLVAVGRRPATEGIGLEELGVETDPRGYIVVDGKYQTNVPGVFAIGDLIGGLLLAHKAEEEGIACVERLATGYGHINYNTIPIAREKGT
ncbi:MAG: FAD-dependent oxidoreductase, partial [Acidobacteriota bacterium]